MQDKTLELFQELICCLSKHLLNYTRNESQSLKVIRVAIDSAILEYKEKNHDKYK